jgi:thiamine-monophosphate kinase
MTISGEQKRLEIIREILTSQPSQSFTSQVQLVAGVGDADDCAVYDIQGNLSLVVGTDFVRGTNFTLFRELYLDYFDIGYYLVVANLSDIAAMGAIPVGLTTVVRYPDSLEDADFTRLIEGIQEAAVSYHTRVIGGDIGGYTEMVLAATAFGFTERGKYLRRRGTVEGDALCITGTVGLPSTALVYFTKAKKVGFQLSNKEEQVLLDSWRRPVAHIADGNALAQLGVVHACQDISDGAKATIDQLGRASNLSFEIYESHLPIHPITKKVAAFLQIDPIALAFSASVDFQLMFTVASQNLDTVQQALEASGSSLHIIGQAINNSASSKLVCNSGIVSDIPGLAWNQQEKDVTEVILEQSYFSENVL